MEAIVMFAQEARGMDARYVRKVNTVSFNCKKNSFVRISWLESQKNVRHLAEIGVRVSRTLFLLKRFNTE